MNEQMIQIIASFFAVIGFSLVFNIHGKKIFIIGIGGALCQTFYIIFYNCLNNKVLCCLFATAIIAALVEILSRIIKTPIVLLLVPMLLPLFPGSDLYYMMSFFVDNDMQQAASIGYLLLGEAGAIALGIILVTSMTQIILKTSQYIRKACSIKQ